MRKFFTLIELLVVVAIIGILASILIPSLAKARSKAKTALCISNQKQIAIATSSYLVDSDSYFPPGSETWSGKYCWDDLISSDLGRDMTAAQIEQTFVYKSDGIDSSILQCPEDKIDRGADRLPRSYSISSGQVWSGQGFTGISCANGLSRKVEQVVEAENTLMYTERILAGNRVGGTGAATLGSFVSGHWKDGVHGSLTRRVAVMCDGHVEFLESSVIWAEKMDIVK